MVRNKIEGCKETEMNVVMTRDAVRASKVDEKMNEKEVDVMLKEDSEERKTVDHDNNNKNIDTNGPKQEDDSEIIMIKRQFEEIMDVNRLLKKQLESRDAIIKKQISEIHRLQGENKVLLDKKEQMKTENDNLRKEYEAEQWLGERLKHDIRDLQMQLDFQDCYLQEQSHQSNLMDNLLTELQKRNEAQEKEIIQLRKQLHSGKEKVDNQIADLQKMLGIKPQS